MIRDLTGGLNAILQISDNILLSQCAMTDEGIDPITNPDVNYSRDLQLCPVDILFLYTELAIEENPDIEDLIEIGISTTNEIIKNSGIFYSKLYFDKVQVQGIPETTFKEGGLINDDKELIHQPDPNIFPDITELRDAYNADIVILLTGAAYGSVAGAVSEIGEDNGSSKDQAYGIVAGSFIGAPVYALPHEIFHLYGARHEQKLNPPESTNCPQSGMDEGNIHAHGYLIKKHSRKGRRHTIMAVCLTDIYAPERIRRIKHLSNPFIKFKRWKTGIENTNYNAKQVNDNACTIAEYRTNNRPFVSIDGPLQVCADAEYLYLTAIVGGL